MMSSPKKIALVSFVNAANNNISQSWQQLLKQEKAIAVIRSPDLALGYAMATAISTGGMGLIEITWNSHQPAQLISKLRANLPNSTIGTGTILTLEQLQQAIACGAQFIFCPHYNAELIQAALNANIPIIPGALSPTEIITAWQNGASCVKVFPVQAVGGVNYIKSLQGPLGNIPLIPTGGVTLENAQHFLKAGAIAVGLSSQLFPPPLLAQQNWEAIALQAQKLRTHLGSKGVKE